MTGHPTGMGGFGGMQVGNKRGMSDVCWQPAHSTRLITASEDDTSPIIMVWDLRNSLAPEKILSGHDKGILSLSWCEQDQDLLLSCGKDNRTICWNPQTCEIVGEVSSQEVIILISYLTSALLHSFLPVTTGLSRLHGVLGTPICWPPRPSMGKSESTLCNKPSKTVRLPRRQLLRIRRLPMTSLARFPHPTKLARLSFP